MWLFFQYQQHAAKSEPESNSNAILSKPGPFTDPYSIAKPYAIAEPDSYARGPIGLISGDLVL